MRKVCVSFACLPLALNTIPLPSFLHIIVQQITLSLPPCPNTCETNASSAAVNCISLRALRSRLTDAPEPFSFFHFFIVLNAQFDGRARGSVSCNDRMNPLSPSTFSLTASSSQSVISKKCLLMKSMSFSAIAFSKTSSPGVSSVGPRPWSAWETKKSKERTTPVTLWKTLHYSEASGMLDENKRVPGKSYALSRFDIVPLNNAWMGAVRITSWYSNSMEAILASHSALSTKWLDRVAKWCERWRMRTVPIVLEAVHTVWIDSTVYCWAVEWTLLSMSIWFISIATKRSFLEKYKSSKSCYHR